MTPPLLTFDRVRLRAPLSNITLLDDISFHLNPGDRCVLIGPSGSGKTQLLRLCNRLSDADRGEIRFEDQPIATWPVRRYRETVTLVLQESSLLSQTVETAIAYPLTLRGLKPATIQQRLADWCDRLNLPTEWLPKTEAQLSVGQRQWVALTRALAIEPKVLLLDEPTSALDAGRSDRLIRVLIDLADRRGTATIMTTHQFDIAREFATRLLYLENGRLLRDVSAEAVDWEVIKREVIAIEQKSKSEWD